jgi:hypothetical protein
MKRFSVSLIFGSLLLCNLAGCKLLMETTPEKQPIKAPPLNITQKVPMPIARHGNFSMRSSLRARISKLWCDNFK